jgi:hypothetical protein
MNSRRVLWGCSNMTGGDLNGWLADSIVETWTQRQMIQFFGRARVLSQALARRNDE